MNLELHYGLDFVPQKLDSEVLTSGVSEIECIRR